MNTPLTVSSPQVADNAADPKTDTAMEAAEPHFYMGLEDKWGAHNYAPLPVVIARAEGACMFDIAGTRYLDFLAAYSAVNQGHCHPRIVKSMVEQCQRLTLTSRAFFNDKLGALEAMLCSRFRYDKCLMMNSGAEAVESAIKLARKWAYDVKGVVPDQALIVTASNNFHGRTSTIISFSTDPDCYNGFGPRMPGFVNISYDDLQALEYVLSTHSADVCAFLVEPIQGEAGVIIPSDKYLVEARRLCTKHNALLICDEIQSGLGRAGTYLACYGPGRTVDTALVRPDMVLLGKALSGGMMPVSCVLADDEVMLCLAPGTHGSTFGGNPLACAIAMTAINVLDDEQLVEKSAELGVYYLEQLRKIQAEFPKLVRTVRGRGLMMAMEIEPLQLTCGSKCDAKKICIALMKRGMLAKQTHEDTIRLTPPLVISRDQLDESLTIMRTIFAELLVGA